MSYILTNIYPDGMPDPKSLNHDEIHQQRWKDYHQHLESKRNKMTDTLQEFAFAGWHYDFTDHKCPHDGWLENLNMVEKVVNDKDGNEARLIDISIKLLGAYHDLYIYLEYYRVKTYCFDQPRRDSVFPHNRSTHSDWLLDELVIEGKKNYIHKIIWSSGATWYIHFEDIKVSFEEISEK